MTTLKVALGILFFGIMAALSLAPFNLWPLGFLILFPVFYIIDNTRYNLKKTLVLGYLLTLSFNLLAAYWLIYTINVFGHIPWIFALVVFFLYTLISAGRYTIFLLLIKAWDFLKSSEDFPLKRILENRYFAYSFAWGFSEYFGWQLFHALGGNFAAGNKYLSQTVDLVGIYGLSIFWFLINLVIYDLIIIFLKNKSSLNYKVFLKNKSLNVTVVFIFLLHLYGFFAYNYWKSRNLDYPKKRIALIQGSAPLSFESNRSLFNQVKGTLDSIMSQTQNLMDEEEKKGTKPDLLVWPESSVPFLNIQFPGIFSQTLDEFHKKYKVPMIINDVYSESLGRRNQYFNNLWLLDANGNKLDNYHKIELLPFGEFIPLAQYYPNIYRLVPEIGGFTPGNEKKILTLNSLKIIPSICYELLPPEFTLDYYNKSGKNGQIIINITNDTWFGLTNEPAEHIKASSLRAIELRLPIVRATNSGISAYINTTGDIINPTDLFTKDSRVYDIPIPDRSHSLFAIVGTWPFRLFLLAGILLWGFSFYRLSLKNN